MKTIIKPFLESHRIQYELTNMCEEDSFEHFVNYLAARSYTSRHFDPAEISLGKGEVGIDGVVVVINDTFVFSLPQLESCFAEDREISASFIFVQSKTSENIETSELNHFFAAVNDFLSNGKINNNSRAIEIKSMCKYILEHPTQLSKNPDCHIVYAYTGSYKSDNHITNGFIEQEREELRKKSIFDDISINIFDADRIVRLCREIRSSIKRTIELSSFAPIPQINNVNESYVGIVSCKDFIKLITNEQGAIISNLFEDNVRYFQGDNIVNSEMQSTIRDINKQQEFSILNNGITIVAKEVRLTGKNITFSDFQIVNGCQTSFVLYENRNRLKDDTCVVVKIISTTDKDITDRIVRTTNRQTPVQNEAFETLRDFHKNLEDVYASYPVQQRLYYERRSKQYDSSGDDMNRNKIISFPFQTTAYTAVFLGEPHSTHRYYGELLKSYKYIYSDGDILEQYSMASMYVYTVDKYLKDNNLLSRYRQYKFHIALLLRCIVAGKQIPKQNSNEMKKLCDELFRKIADADWVSINIPKIIQIIDDISASSIINEKDGNSIIRQKEFTNLLLEKLGVDVSATIISKSFTHLKKGLVVNCKVTGWNSSFAYLELIDYREKGSVHIREITGEYIYDIADVLKLNQIVRATIIDNQLHRVYGYCLSIRQANNRAINETNM